MLRFIKYVVISSLVLGLVGCSTSPKTQVVQFGDQNLTEQAILQELAKLDESKAAIKGKKGFTATNVASVIFWWPGIAYTYMDAGEADRLVEQRRIYLTSLYNQKFGALPHQSKKA